MNERRKLINWMAGVTTFIVVLLIVIGIQQTIKMRTSFLQNLPISYAWFYAAIPVGCAYLLYEYILILVFGKNPFASSPGEDDNVTGAF